MTSTPIRAMFFDVGGTLLRPRPSVGAVYAAVGARHGFSATEAAMETAFRLAWKTTLPAASGLTTGDKDWWRRLVFAILDQLGLGGMPDRREAYFRDLFAAFARADAWEMFPDTLEAVRLARAQGWHVGVISNWDERLRTLLGAVGLDRWDSLTVSCEVGAEKPDPRIFQAAMRAAAVPAAAAVHIGDSRTDDLMGARAVGMRAVLVDRRGRLADGGPVAGNLRDAVVLAMDGRC